MVNSLNPPPPAPPSPVDLKLAAAKEHIPDLLAAIERIDGAKTRAQMDDALRSADTFMGLIRSSLAR